VVPTFGEFWPDEADCFLDSVVLQLAATGTTRFFRGEPPIDRWAYARDGVSIGEKHNLVVRAELSEKGAEVARALVQLRSATARHREASDPAYAAERLAQAKQHLDEAARVLQQELGEHSIEELFADYRRVVDEELARRQRHHEVRDSLAALPQLFIAV
jgi:phage terminase large subunit-like protein